MNGKTMRGTTAMVAALLGALALAGCGDPAADGEYLGEPLLRVDGMLEKTGSGELPAGCSIGLLWYISHYDYPFVENESRMLGRTAEISTPRFPASFSLDLFDAPPEGAYPQVDGEAPIELATALIVALDDVDRDGKFTVTDDPDSEALVAPDQMLGVALGLQVVYVRSTPPQGSIAAARFVNPEALTPGYHLAKKLEGSGLEVIAPSTPVSITIE